MPARIRRRRTRGGRRLSSRGNHPQAADTRSTEASASAPARDHPSESDENNIVSLINLRIVDQDTDEERTIGDGSSEDEAPLFDSTPFSVCRLPPLRPPTGPPIKINGLIAGSFVVLPNQDPRNFAVSTGFPVSVHPLRIPNARAEHSSGSTHSVIDFKFVRLAGLLHTMVPLRPGVDDVKFSNIFGQRGGDVKGYVDVVFDALGYEFEQRCWVINLGSPFELQLGRDWARHNRVVLSFSRYEPTVFKADAKRARPLDDTYIIR